MDDYNSPDPDDKENWKKALDKGDGGIQFTPEEQWGEVHEVKPPMNWPQAVASTVTLIVLFMVLWGPW
jgi:hypothetical protein